MNRPAAKKHGSKKSAKTSESKSGTPVRQSLNNDSLLRPLVQDGLAAVQKTDHAYFDVAIRADVADSLDLDEATRLDHDQENRWDYLIGISSSGAVVAVEPHSAREDQIETVIKKRDAARNALHHHMTSVTHIKEWFWVAAGNGKMHFADTEKARRRLDKHGIKCVNRIQAVHLPKPPKK
jgi:hypothetical protein